MPQVNNRGFLASISELPRNPMEELEARAPKRYSHGMKFFAAIVAYLLIGLVLGAGIYEAVQGHLWLLAVAVLAYILSFVKLGCLPSRKSH